jgi:aerobic C4-dicarboxylate transport protein
MASGTQSPDTAAPARRDRTHWLYISVIVAVILGIIVGFVFPTSPAA